MQESLVDIDTNYISPLWVHLFSDEPDTLLPMEWQNIEAWNQTFFQYLYNSGISLELREVPKV